MAKTVRVKVGNLPDSPVRVMSEAAAQRLVSINPQGYRILEPPKVDVINLPPLETVEPQKKSVIVADVEKPEEFNARVSEHLDKVEEKRKPGRPKANA